MAEWLKSTKYNYILKLLNLPVLFLMKGLIVKHLFIWVLFKFVLWWGDEHYFLPWESGTLGSGLLLWYPKYCVI